MRFQVLKVTNIKVAVLWVAALCSLVDTECHSRGAYCLRHHGYIIVLMLEAVSTRLQGAMTQKTIMYSDWAKESMHN